VLLEVRKGPTEITLRGFWGIWQMQPFDFLHMKTASALAS